MKIMVQANITHDNAGRFEVVVRYHEEWNGRALKTSGKESKGIEQPCMVLLDDGTFSDAFCNGDGKYVIGNSRKLEGKLHDAARRFTLERKVLAGEVTPVFHDFLLHKSTNSDKEGYQACYFIENYGYQLGYYRGNGILDGFRGVGFDGLVDCLIHLSKAAKENWDEVKLVVTGDNSVIEQIARFKDQYEDVGGFRWF